ncbi:glycosyl hydrolase 2 galactose-binding domain-containing protein [Devosia sp.]|uniref:glycoside hydrolase family 2 protein n=1 Tax=Devosia sp. TaxID=1871048 RepID=UPI003264AA91
MALSERFLHAGWTLSRADASSKKPGFAGIPARVPGTVHTDLLAARLVPDPYLDLNEITLDWIGKSDWRYDLSFDWDGNSTAETDLVCLGLDTVAEIVLNGAIIGETRNMNRTYRLDVAGMLRHGANTLSITFQSALAYGEALARVTSPRPNNYPGPANLMRKMACNFGWDWGPTLVTAGIWQPISLQSWSIARLASVRPQVILNGADGQVHIDVDIAHARTGHTPLTLSATIAGVRTAIELAEGAEQANLDLLVANPAIWWPHGRGSQPLYDIEIELSSNGEILDRWSRRIGFRSLRLDTAPDEVGSAFTFVINDVPVYICGANWIPDDCFLPRVTPERYKQRIAQARAANINMLRVWGGGIYETEAFYQACNEAGMLVWQDFLFACAAYPEEGDLPGEIEAEVRDNVVRLMPHPSLVLWNGNNENIWGWFDWGWQDVLEGRTWGLGYYLGLLPRLVAELDPARPYWAGSPYSGSMAIHPNDPNHGCTHIWDVWNDIGYENYRNSVPRFSSEFGWQAPPTWATLTQSIHDEPMTPTSPGVWHHQKATIGNDKLLRGLKGHLPEPTNMDDWHFATQLNQARAIRFGIEHWRSHRPTNMGAIVWQLNDCWPVTSWAAIDGYGRLKPLWYALRAAYHPHLLTIQPRGQGLSVVAVNERTLFWRGPVKIRRLRFDGTVLAEYNHWRLSADRLSAEPLAIPADVATPGDPRSELLVATMHDSTALYYFNEDIDLDLPAALASVTVDTAGDDHLVTVTANTLIKDLCLMVDRIHPDATVDDMLITLLPGQSRAFKVCCPLVPSPAQLSTAPVFRCVNQLFIATA